MAARTNKVLHAEKTKKLIGATQLLKRLKKHADGELEMTQTQIQAAKIYIGKYIPDLKAMELTGPQGGPVPISIQVSFRDTDKS